MSNANTANTYSATKCSPGASCHRTACRHAARVHRTRRNCAGHSHTAGSHCRTLGRSSLLLAPECCPQEFYSADVVRPTGLLFCECYAKAADLSLGAAEAIHVAGHLIFLSSRASMARTVVALSSPRRCSGTSRTASDGEWFLAVHGVSPDSQMHRCPPSWFASRSHECIPLSDRQ